MFLGLFTAKNGVCGSFLGLLGAKIRPVGAFLLYCTFNLLRVSSLIYKAIDQLSTQPFTPLSRNHAPCFISYIYALFKTANYLLWRTSYLIQKHKPVYKSHIAPQSRPLFTYILLSRSQSKAISSYMIMLLTLFKSTFILQVRPIDHDQ